MVGDTGRRRILAWGGLVSCILLAASSAEGGHRSASADGAIPLDARHATPGVRLELTELSSPTTRSSDTARYRLRVTGQPQGVVFNVWAEAFGRDFREIASGFRVDEAGQLVSSQLGDAGRPRPLEEMAFEPGPYPRGAVWEVAVVSGDRTIAAFAKVVPRPIVGRDGPCTVALELVSHRGDRFIAVGTGFAPGDDVIVESRYAGRVIQKRRRTSVEGGLPPEVISHVATGTDRSASYAAKGRSCEVTLEYEWGEQALSPH
jgi:hypothetical protein